MGWKKPIPPSSGHPHLGLTLLGQVLNRAYYFCHTRDAEEQGAAESALRFPSPRVSEKKKKKKAKANIP